MSFEKCNDYVRIVKSYFRDYEYYQIALDNLTTRARELEEQLVDVSTKIAKYEQNPGGSSELTEVEAEANNKLIQEERFRQCMQDLSILRNHLDKLERCISALPDEDREMLLLHYSSKMSYPDLAEYKHWSARTCRRRVTDSIEKVALMLFGEKCKDNIRFIT